nr:SOS response-associated peptidase [Acidocella sp. KAb 2-4]
MPVLIEKRDWPLWLGEQEGVLCDLLHPPGNEVLRAWPVSRHVNDPRHNTPSLLDNVA